LAPLRNVIFPASTLIVGVASTSFSFLLPIRRLSPFCAQPFFLRYGKRNPRNAPFFSSFPTLLPDFSSGALRFPFVSLGSFFVLHVRCVFFIPSTSLRETRFCSLFPTLFYFSTHLFVPVLRAWSLTLWPSLPPGNPLLIDFVSQDFSPPSLCFFAVEALREFPHFFPPPFFPSGRPAPFPKNVQKKRLSAKLDFER